MHFGGLPAQSLLLKATNIAIDSKVQTFIGTTDYSPLHNLSNFALLSSYIFILYLLHYNDKDMLLTYDEYNKLNETA